MLYYLVIFNAVFLIRHEYFIEQVPHRSTSELWVGGLAL